MNTYKIAKNLALTLVRRHGGDVCTFNALRVVHLEYPPQLGGLIVPFFKKFAVQCTVYPAIGKLHAQF